MEGSEVRWNIFARELQDIMRRRNRELGHIDDATSIHREKIRRLQHSLKTPKRFPLLNPVDLDMLIDRFDLTDDDIIRLRAGILATSVEATLMGRIAPQDALRAAEQVFDIVVASLRNGGGDLSAVRHGGGFADTQEESDDVSIELEPALTAIDWGSLSIHLANQSNSQAQRIAYLQQARASFDYALQEIKEMQEMVDSADDTATIAIWREEAKRGLDTAMEELEDAGVRVI